MPPIELLSSDLNGTLVQPHTMQEMVRFAFPHDPQRYETAKKAFSLQTEGRLGMEETFQTAGEQTRGLSLRAAVDYALDHMAFMDGYGTFTKFLLKDQIHLAIISTGYSVTLYAMRHGTSTPPFHARCNRLLFSDPTGHTLSESELEACCEGDPAIQQARNRWTLLSVCEERNPYCLWPRHTWRLAEESLRPEEQEHDKN